MLMGKKKKKKLKPTKAQRVVNAIVLVFSLLCIAYYLVLGFGVRFGQSLMFLWPAVGLACIGHYLLWMLLFKTGKRPPKALHRLIAVVFFACLAFFLAVEGVIFAGGQIPAEPNLDYVIVLGAKVNGREPSGALNYRCASAAEYLKANPDTRAVLSGGQGADEEISEAQCMLEQLTGRGIEADRLILEDKSTDTSENLRYSFEKIGDESATVGVVTNDFHMFRARAIAKKLGRPVYGVSVPTTWISFPHYMVREFVGVLYDGIRGELAF